jgi:hypothetical protein
MRDERGAKEPHPVFSRPVSLTRHPFSISTVLAPARHRNGLAADDSLTMPFSRWPLANLKDHCSFSHCRGFFWIDDPAWDRFAGIFGFFGAYRATLPEIRISNGAQTSATLLEIWA